MNNISKFSKNSLWLKKYFSFLWKILQKLSKISITDIMVITRAHVQENERNKKLYRRELYTNESGIKATDCQYFLAFRLTSNDDLLHELRKVQDEYLTQDRSLGPMLEPLEKNAHILLNIIRCDERRLDELKKLISEAVKIHNEKPIISAELKVKGLGIEKTSLYPYHTTSIVAKFQSNEGRFFYFHGWLENILHDNGFETFDHSLSEDITLFRAKSGHEFKPKLRFLKPYATADFGALTMRELGSLHLCSMKSTAPASEDGFYHIEETYDLNLCPTNSTAPITEDGYYDVEEILIKFNYKPLTNE